MSGGYEIGPDGVLVRPAEHAASTYSKPELPEEAKEHTERGAELAAEYLIDTITYAWNTGDTQPLADMSDPSSNFANSRISEIESLYSHGWTYGNESRVVHVLRLENVSQSGSSIPENTIGVRLQLSSSDGVTCTNQRISTSDAEYSSTMSLFMSWQNGRWIEVQGSATNHE